MRKKLIQIILQKITTTILRQKYWITGKNEYDKKVGKK